jgi:hypothetical protein
MANETALPTCGQLGVKFCKEAGFWVSKINGQTILTYKQEGACKRNTEKFLNAHNGYYRRCYGV